MPGKKLRYLTPGKKTKWKKKVPEDVRQLITQMVDPEHSLRPQLREVARHTYFLELNEQYR